MKKTVSIIMSLLFVLFLFTACSAEESKTEDESLKFVTDYHYSDYDESALRGYEKLCSAVINGESEAKFNTALIDDVNRLFYTSFPLNALTEKLEISGDGSGVVITYKNDAEAHKTAVEDFNAKIKEIIAFCSDAKSTDRYIFNVYTYLTSEFSVNNENVTVYDTVMTSSGAPSAINSLFEYLVLLHGGKASHIMNITGTAVMLSLVEFDSEFYYFDPAGEISDNGGKALKFFAMNDSRAQKKADAAFTYTDNEKAPEIKNEKYNQLSQSTQFTADKNKVVVKYGTNEQINIDIS